MGSGRGEEEREGCDTPLLKDLLLFVVYILELKPITRLGNVSNTNTNLLTN